MTILIQRRYDALVLDFLEPGKFKDYRLNLQLKTSLGMSIIHSLCSFWAHWIIAYQHGAFEAVRSNGKGSFQGLKKWSEQFCIGSTFLYS